MTTDPGDLLTRVRDAAAPVAHAGPGPAPAREPGALRPQAALRWLAIALALAVLAYALALELQLSVIQRVPAQLSAGALTARARDGLRRLGIPEAAHSAGGLDYDGDILRHFVHRASGRERWENLRTGQPAAVFFWYRESPRPLVAAARLGDVSEGDPALTEPGSVSVRLDSAGRLVSLRRVQPRDLPPLLERREADWSRLFAEAGLDPKRLRRIEGLFVPPVFADERDSWIGTVASRPEIRVRVDAAALYGRPVYFEIVGPWSLEPLRAFELAGWEAAAAALLLAGLLMARRNLRLGRGDRAGALRLGAFAFVLVMLQWLLQAGHVRDALLEWGLLQRGVAFALFWSGSLALCYVALEPYLRWHWPRADETGRALIAGALRDPRVGRDVLIGLAAGYAMLVLACLMLAAPATFGGATARLASGADLRALSGWRGLLGAMCEAARLALYGGFAATTLLVLLRFTLRRPPLVAAAWVLLVALAGLGAIELQHGGIHAVDPLLVGAGVLVAYSLLTRVGLVATMAGLLPLASGQVLPIAGGSWSAWYAPSLLLPVALQAVLVGCAFLGALGGRARIGDERRA
jgi:hypothetical protein